jgi:hypothetical protein
MEFKRPEGPAGGSTIFSSPKCDAAIRAEVMRYIASMGVNLTQRRFMVMVHKNLSLIGTVPFTLTYQTTGMRFWLLFWKRNDVKQTVLISTKMKDGMKEPMMYLLKFQGSDELYSGNILEVEVVDDEMIVSDIICGGAASLDREYAVRYIELAKFLGKNLAESQYEMRYKQLWPISRWQQCVDFMMDTSGKMKCIEFHNPNPSFKGLIWFFSPSVINMESRMERHKQIINVGGGAEEKKEGDAAVPVDRAPTTLTMERTSTIDVYRLISSEGVDEGYAYIRGIDASRTIREWFKSGMPRVSARCEWNRAFDKWEPKTLES